LNLASKDQNLVADSASILKALIRPICAQFRGLEREDAMQEVMVALWQSAASYDASRPAEPWIATIAKRRLVSLAEAATSKRRCPTEPIVPMSHEIIDSLAVPTARPDEEPTLSLPGLSFLEQMSIRGIARGDSYSQVARDMAVTPKCIDNALNRARTKLRKEIKGFGKGRGNRLI
jgi:DNA-directed RNA polymerase specialized sigma24 family protein